MTCNISSSFVLRWLLLSHYMNWLEKVLVAQLFLETCYILRGETPPFSRQPVPLAMHAFRSLSAHVYSKE